VRGWKAPPLFFPLSFFWGGIPGFRIVLGVSWGGTGGGAPWTFFALWVGGRVILVPRFDLAQHPFEGAFLLWCFFWVEFEAGREG
jgi:hypothetical protein